MGRQDSAVYTTHESSISSCGGSCEAIQRSTFSIREICETLGLALSESYAPSLSPTTTNFFARSRHTQPTLLSATSQRSSRLRSPRLRHNPIIVTHTLLSLLSLHSIHQLTPLRTGRACAETARSRTSAFRCRYRSWRDIDVGWRWRVPGTQTSRMS
jgi:hypothetical protein